MDETYYIKDISKEKILEECKNKLRALKSAPNPGNIWNCNCAIYQDNIKQDDCCDSLALNIERAYTSASTNIRVTISCYSAPAPTLEPTSMRMGW